MRYSNENLPQVGGVIVYFGRGPNGHRLDPREVTVLEVRPKNKLRKVVVQDGECGDMKVVKASSCEEIVR